MRREREASIWGWRENGLWVASTVPHTDDALQNCTPGNYGVFANQCHPNQFSSNNKERNIYNITKSSGVREK